MVTLTINGVLTKVPEGTTILEAAKSVGIEIPHLCYLKDINEIGACRVCCVEVEGEGALVPSCNTVVREGMNVKTNSPRARSASMANLQMIMAQHDGRCTVCDRSGTCQLQDLTNRYKLFDNRYGTHIPTGKDREWDESFPLQRDPAKCIKCMRCIQICNKVQSLGVWDLMGTGGRARVDVAEHKSIQEADCSLCGQCITHCPTGALRERKDVNPVIAKVNDPDVVTVVQIAPAVRSAWCEDLGMTPNEASVNKLAGALRAAGFDYVFDTSFSADLTIMEEGSELLERLAKGDLAEYPMFTSCCPGWVRFLKAKYPELTGQLSTAKSPQQMFGASIKSYFAEKIGVDPSKICCVSIMPCVSKKSECDLPTMVDKNGNKDVDYVLTTREVTQMMNLMDINVEAVEESPFDSICSAYTGAGVIFGTTGGVLEAALRSAYYFVTGEKPNITTFALFEAGETPEKPWKEATYKVGDAEVRVAVASGLGNADQLCSAIVRKQVSYDFVEVMACPGGCAGGGGQPFHIDDEERAASRGAVLRHIDRASALRFSHENPDVQTFYRDYLGTPLSERAEELLHTNHFGWEMPGTEQ